MDNITVLTRLGEACIQLLPKVASAIAILIAFWLIAKLLQRVMHRLTAFADPERREVLDLLIRIINVAAWVIGIISALGTLGINVSAMVAGLGLTGFAIGFALKDALSNLLAGLLILVHKPFRRNDHIATQGLEGRVIDINLRYTILQSEGKKIFIPNATLFTNIILLFDKSGPQ